MLNILDLIMTRQMKTSTNLFFDMEMSGATYYGIWVMDKVYGRESHQGCRVKFHYLK